MNHPQTVAMARILDISERKLNLWDKIDKEFVTVNQYLTNIEDKTGADTYKTMERTALSSRSSLILSAIAVLCAALFISKTISTPLSNLVGTTMQLVEKNWSVDIPNDHRQDEIGKMTRALLMFRDGGIENEKLQKIQDGENAKRLERSQKIEAMVTDFQGTSEKSHMP